SAGTYRSADKADAAPGSGVTHGQVGAIVCDHSPTVYIGHIFRAVIRGVLDAGLYMASAIAVGDYLIATSTAGKLAEAALGGATETLANNIIAAQMIRLKETLAATGGAAANATRKVEICLALSTYNANGK
ncbi:MAG TPA: hypothetical protein VNA25_10435, partial [Phycisphaerae bacterium]|nr:hypothetical protein [Phycisphaerae bacterium]